MNVQDYFGGMDIYLFDQVQKGRFTKTMKILDAGCGNGRNMIYFMREGFDVYGIDNSKTFINNVRFTAKQLIPELPENNFRLESFDKVSFDDNYFDVIINSAIMHFAETEQQFLNWLNELWRLLKVDGIFFVRLASLEGVEDKVEKIKGRRYHLPDGSDRFLIDDEMLLDLTRQLGAELMEPIKTTNVQNMRAMTTWVIRKLDKEVTEEISLKDSQGLKLFRE